MVCDGDYREEGFFVVWCLDVSFAGAVAEVKKV